MGLDKYYWMCTEPYTNIFNHPDGYYGPCCVMSHYDLPEDSLKHTTSQMTHLEYWNSNIMKRLRKAMRDGGDDEFLFQVCAQCKNREDKGINSIRNWYNSRFYEDHGEFKDYVEEFEKIVETECEPTFYHSMEFLAAGGNTCNLACNMCNESSSSTWHKESKLLGEKLIRDEWKLPELKGGLPDVANMNLLELKLTGGEPLMMKSTWELIERTNAKILRIITNGNVTISQKRWDLFKKFDKVTINLSIEGPKDVNTYIRYPSKWEVIQKNIQRMTSIKNFEVYYVSTINALNISHLPLIDDSVVTESVCESLVTNNFYRLDSIPDDVKEVYLDRLWSQTNFNKQELVEKLTILLQTTKWNEFDMWKMLAHVKRRDAHRGTNLIDLLPEWKYYYENCSS
jgi:hypothetical protein